METQADGHLETYASGRRCRYFDQRASASHVESALGRFRTKLTTSKWAAIAKCSSETALRDILHLVERGILVRKPGAGRNISYSLPEVK